MTTMHEVLGNRIYEIYEHYKLNEKEKEVAEKILIEWEKLYGNIPAKIKIAMELLQYNVNRANILHSIIQISKEVLLKSDDIRSQ